MGLFSRKASTPPPRVISSPSSPAPPSPGAPGEARIAELGRELLDRARSHKTSLLSSKFYSDALMDWSMKDPAFKVQMFRFVDAFPTLRSAEAVHDHLEDYLSQPGVTVPGVIAAALKAGRLAKSASASVISSQIRSMAGKFIAGTDAASSLARLRQLWQDGLAFSVDLLGEACVSDAEADAYRDKYLDLVRNLPSQVGPWEANPRLESDHLGPIPRVNVSIKISSLSPRCDPIDTQGSINDLLTRLLPILETARDRGVFINFDMEQGALKDLTIELFQRCAEAVNFQGGLALQAYLRSGVEDARRLGAWAKRSGKVVSVRLVKGAYWDYETIHAEMMGWAPKVWGEKWQTDACFEEMTRVLLDACPRPGGGGGVKLALGSHNARSIAAALAALEARELPRNAIEIQMLHGMADPLKAAAAEMGLRVREYVPVGEMIPGMAYLVRRLLENTSNESWLKAGFLDNADPGVLLAPPAPRPGGPAVVDRLATGPERHALSPSPAGVGDARPFFNEPFRDFSRAEVREAFDRAVAGATVPRVPSDRTPEQAREMVARALSAFPRWRDADPSVRARVLIEAAARMRAQRDGLAGVMIKEAGKTWREADADVCEAIDFCEYYARTAPGLFDRQRLGRFLGELDEAWHQPRGVAVVIAPWNFPLAILCGMTVAAIVTGNTVIIKPAEQTTGIASIFFDIMQDALGAALGSGLPKTDDPAGAVPGADPSRATLRDVLHFCPAPGESTGASLVRDPRVALIAFTGSKAVGLDIAAAAGVPGSLAGHEPTHLKRVICEMGGKNALIIDTSADLDEAVLAVRHSAFGFQGQKCSACSRVIVVDPEGPDGPAITHFTRRLVEATRALTLGDPSRPGTDVGPVIDDEAAARIRRFIDGAQREGAVLELALEPDWRDPYLASVRSRFVPPHVFSRVRPEHAIAREEIFGPVVAVLHAPDFDAALALANSLPYKLTGGVFTRKPAHIERAKRFFRVGNLYINRGITGALVARQPFGGFAMSGVGSKAGGAEYLLQFVEPRASCENTLRRGFSPEL